MSIVIREYQTADVEAVNALAQAAFAEYENHFEDWEPVCEEWSRMSHLNEHGQVLVAEDDGTIIGAVCYLGPEAPKPPWYEPDWAVIRSLVVDPRARSRGTGTQLTEACIARAKREWRQTIGLLTSPIMGRATALYEKLGFVVIQDCGVMNGVHWLLYTKTLGERAADGTS